VPDQPDELTGELRGVADPFLSWDALVLGPLSAADGFGASHLVFLAADGLKGA